MAKYFLLDQSGKVLQAFDGDYGDPPVEAVEVPEQVFQQQQDEGIPKLYVNGVLSDDTDTITAERNHLSRVQALKEVNIHDLLADVADLALNDNLPANRVADLRGRLATYLATARGS